MIRRNTPSVEAKMITTNNRARVTSAASGVMTGSKGGVVSKLEAKNGWVSIF